jgi:adenylate cyclase class IV
MPAFEVEEKFSLTGTDVADVEARLRELGWYKAAEQSFTDWYFDSTAHNTLMRQDVWLRYRCDDDKGEWQLKQRRHQSDGLSSKRRTTVYEEIEGFEAVKLAASLASQEGKSKEGTTSTGAQWIQDFKDLEIPELPISCDVPLEPFAVIATHRSRWKPATNDPPLVVDLDFTDYGHAVGEVEAVVGNDSEIPQAQQLIQDFLKQLLPPEQSTQKRAMGKLDYYLQKNRPELYQICIDLEILQSNTS